MTAHAKLSASASARWMTCPGSVVLEKGLPDQESDHARLGSAAHALGEHCLLEGEHPFEHLDEPHPVAEFTDLPVDVDMVDAVTVYVDHVRSLLPLPGRHQVERRVSLEKLGDWADGMFGTADFVAVVDHTLFVVDYKHGQGVVVEAEGNTQFQYYGLGALLDLHRPDEVRKVCTTVVQPRAHHGAGPVRSSDHSPEELKLWAKDELKPAVETVKEAESREGEAGWAERYLNPSEKACKFCKAKGFCPALAAKAMNDAMLEFDGEGQVTPQVPLDQLTEEQIAQILDNERAIKDWLAGVATLAQNALSHGKDITGGRYKLVAGRSSRSWQSEDVAATRLASLGFEDDEIYSRKLLTPAQAEKLVGKEQAKTLVDLVNKQDGKPTLAPADDKRPALVTGPEEDFK